MKGVKYNLTIKLKDNEEFVKKNIDIFELIETTKRIFKTKYDLEVHINKTISYNILNKNKEGFKKRPNKLFRELVEIKKYYDII